MVVNKPQTVDPTREQRMAWWKEARFGMFIHYGAYSQLGRGEWVMNRERISPADYEPFTDAFAPKADCAREWARTAKDAGMKYVVLTTRHHDGFCLWDSKLTNYTAVQRGPERDIVAEFVEALRDEDLRVGLYYSLKDWHHPNWLARQRGDELGHEEFVQYIHGQVRELCSNYGKIDILWYDGPGPYREDGWRSDEMNGIARELQPGIIINCRSHTPEDFDTPEQHVKPSQPGRAWESCMTLNTSWGYHHGDDNYKSPGDVVGLLSTVVHGGGNLLLNIGPEPDGSVPPQSADILRRVGRWMRVNGEAIRGADRSAFQWGCYGRPTQKDNAVYLIQTKYLGPEFTLAGAGTAVRDVELLATGKKLAFQQDGDYVTISGQPEASPDPIAAVVKVSFADTPVFTPYPG
ncbi:MAG: alpha-L-fucosidase [Lentisphaerae bacterium]|jgi:alpha-L-fucosidase|nr:alpha-L-fucosidase [Lentisphaerota bacterium]MBT4820458.1 alpha-L-fucosidase [Lentisphaerota bacterium]MBT5610384.1 alpha-L-fucosidase [Lentisphaerota bacterium]MBT7056212.1 alpha-L-fucosidase [Lentisphaerota bacterium]MBT7841866.1 alpha-L-fucosidase [Lentisphaerota bacterium]